MEGKVQDGVAKKYIIIETGHHSSATFGHDCESLDIDSFSRQILQLREKFPVPAGNRSLDLDRPARSRDAAFFPILTKSLGANLNVFLKLNTRITKLVETYILREKNFGTLIKLVTPGK
jgi:hypothetical protein